MQLQCRRCPKQIGEEEVAHLVAVRGSGYTLSSELNQCIIVCDGCLDSKEKGFQETGYVYVPKEPPPLVVPPGLIRILEQVALGRVFRKPRRVMFYDPYTDEEKRITDRAYELLRLGLTRWEVIPSEQQIPGGPNAWMRLTDDGKEFLHYGAMVTK
jgi:hypothetical protein